METGEVWDSLMRCLFIWGRPQARGELARAQAICSFAFSDLTNGMPSETNSAMTEAAHQLQKMLSLPIYAQGEVARLLHHRKAYVSGQTKTQAEARWRGDPYIETIDVVLEHERPLIEHGYKRVIPIAYHPYFWRAVWTLERRGFTVIIPESIPELVSGEKVTPWTHRGLFRNNCYEFCARLYYLYKGYI